MKKHEAFKTHKKNPSLPSDSSKLSIIDYSSEKSVAVFDSVQSPRPAHPERCLHAHPHYELLYITSGAREFYSMGQSHRAEAGDLIIFYPWVGHVEYAGSRKVSYFSFRISHEDLAKAHTEFPKVKNNRPIINLPHKQQFISHFNQMVEEFRHPKDDSEILLGAYLAEFIIKLRRSLNEISPKEKAPSKHPSHERIRDAMDLLQNNVAHNVNLQKLAQQTFMSVSHLSHTFKNQVGVSPRRYQIRERIRQARALLLETGKPASEIADQLGYESVYYFYRQFKKATGLTTTQFRERFSPQ